MTASESPGVTKKLRPRIRLRSPSPSQAAPKSGASARVHVSDQLSGVHQIRIRVMAAKIFERRTVDYRAGGAPRSSSRMWLRVRSGDCMHGIELHAKAA